MRKYYVEYYRDFGNTYNLYYAEKDFAAPETWEQITRKEAERLARKERSARKNEPMSAGYACDAIYPADYDGDIINDRRYKLIGCIWEKQA